MSQMNAFVGHSFLESDDQIVQKFLAYFDQVKGIVPGFSWENAKQAEPDDLLAKVRRLFKDKNLFIGICTSNEVAIPNDALETPWWPRGRYVVAKSSVKPKTSDWIIQEIGFALARDLTIILFVEEGLRTPGGMQGNLNYISFNRSNAESCFGQFLEMIKTMMPTATVAPAAPMTQESSQEENGDSAPKGEGFLVPKEDWKQDDFELAFMVATIRDDQGAVTRIDDAFKKNPKNKEANKQEAWEVFGEYVRIIHNKGGKLERIEDIADRYADNHEVQHYLGLAYVQFEKFTDAAACFKKSVAGTDDRQIRLHRFGMLAKVLAKAGKHDESNAVIEQLKGSSAEVLHGNSIVAEQLCDIAESMDQDEFWLGLTEYLISLYPDRNSKRFDLAYKYSHLGQHSLALKHHSEIPINDRGGNEWNNLAVEYASARLSHMAVKAYRESEELGETLATSNLAYKLIQAGFLEQAKEMCISANEKDEVHKNVIHALARISDIPGEEELTLKESIDGVDELHQFWNDFGKAATDKATGGLDGHWTGPVANTIVKTKGNRFTAIGEYEVSGSALGNALLGLRASRSEKRRFRVTYEGTILGRSIVCKCEREQIEGKKRVASLLGDGLTDTWTCIMVVNEARDRIGFCDRPLGKNARFASLERLSPNA